MKLATVDALADLEHRLTDALSDALSKAECARLEFEARLAAALMAEERIEIDEELFPILVIGLEFGRNTQRRAPSHGAQRRVRHGPKQRVGRRVRHPRITGKRAVPVEADAHRGHRRIHGAFRHDRRLPTAMQLVAQKPISASRWLGFSRYASSEAGAAVR
jgi:hypothetical protein